MMSFPPMILDEDTKGQCDLTQPTGSGTQDCVALLHGSSGQMYTVVVCQALTGFKREEEKKPLRLKSLVCYVPRVQS